MIRSIGEVRRERLQTIRELAERAGVSTRTVLRIEHGVQTPQLGTIKKLAAALKKMGTSRATHTQSTFKPSGAASRTLDEFKARRAAEKLGLVPKSPGKVAERFQIDVDTAQVTKLPIRPKTVERR